MFELIQDTECPIVALESDAAQFAAFNAVISYLSDDPDMPPLGAHELTEKFPMTTDQAQLAVSCIYNKLTGRCGALPAANETPVEID